MTIDFKGLLDEAVNFFYSNNANMRERMELLFRERRPIDEEGISSLEERLAFFYAQQRYGYVEESHLVGCLLGGAVGDAVGYPVEFLTWSIIQDTIGENGMSGYRLPTRLVFSDDTQMTLFTAEGILRAEREKETPKLNDYVESLHRSYLDWLCTQGENVIGVRTWESELVNLTGLYVQRAPGVTCMGALRSGLCGTFDKKLNNSKGCGGLMRVAPIGAYFAQKSKVQINEIAYLAACAAAITHSHPLGYIPAAFFAAWIASILRGEGLERSYKRAKIVTQNLFLDRRDTSGFLALLDTAKDLARLDDYRESITEVLYDVDSIESLGGGWVAEEAMAIAVYCVFRYPHSFEKAMLAAVNHGGDSDSTGSITGNIMGAFYGVKEIPKYYLERLDLRELVERFAKKMKLHELHR